MIHPLFCVLFYDITDGSTDSTMVMEASKIYSSIFKSISFPISFSTDHRHLECRGSDCGGGSGTVFTEAAKINCSRIQRLEVRSNAWSIYDQSMFVTFVLFSVQLVFCNWSPCLWELTKVATP